MIVEGAGSGAITGGVVSLMLIVCEAVAVFPQASVAVQVLVTEYEPRHCLAKFTSTKVSVTVPPQLSVAVACANCGVSGQEIADVGGRTAITGGVVS